MIIEAPNFSIETERSADFALARRMWTQYVLGEPEQEEDLIASWYEMARRKHRLQAAAAQQRMEELVEA